MPLPAGSRLRFAAPADLSAVRALLDAEQLPSADLGVSRVILLVAEAQGGVAGCVGIEPHGEAGIIRSLVVAPELRGRGLARALVQRAEAHAAAGGVRTLYLLTQGAAAFWRALGYEATARDAAPPAIRASAEFSALCPASAACLRRSLA